MALNSLAPSSSINLQFSSTSIHSHPAIFTSRYAPSSSSSYSSSLSLSQSFHCYPTIRNPDFKGSRRVKCVGKKDKLKVMISGAPASGKGTQCDLIVQKYDLVHISTGDLLRAEVASGTDIGKKAKEYMNSGQLVPDEIVTDMLMSRLSKQDVTEKGWLLDGYPRTSSQAQSLEKMNIKPDIFVLLDVPDEILIDRCIGRRMDPVTRKIYHVKYFPPETEEVSKRLIIRSDDTLEKVKSRLESYKRNTEAILSTYKDLLNKVDGNRSKDTVFSDIDSLLQKVLATAAKSRSLHSSNGDLSVGSLTAGNLDQLQGKWRGIPTRLNNIPHSREIRNYFYNDVLQATLKAVEDKRIRLKVEINIPELNPEMDVYRIGTLMELVRTLALAFAEDGKRVKVCVQGSMGEGALAGMPLQLAGSRKILEYMDWGEYGAKEDFIKIGSIGGKEVEEQDDIFILIAPQNAVGNCIIEDLQAMTTAAGIRPVILINPRLKDLPASSGIMQTMGRDKRLEYAASFENCYFFRLLYYAGTQYPIMGALRCKGMINNISTSRHPYIYDLDWQYRMSSPDCYELFRRIDEPSLKKEKYVLIATFPRKPTGDEINDAFDGKTRSKTTSGFWGFLSNILPA